LNKLILKTATQEYVSYLYRPEGKGEPGEIRMGIGDEKATIVSLANEDSKLGYYAHMATRAVANHVKEHAEDKNFPERFTQAWY